MDKIIDDVQERIASQIRLEREVRNWSLAELAERAGVAKASVSKIERGEMSPSAVILLKLATAFDLTLARLLLKAEGEKPRLIRTGDQPVWRDPETGYRRKQIFARSDHPLELVDVELPPGKRITLSADAYIHIRQLVWVQEGKLALQEDGQRHLLEAGDCLGFGPPSTVTFANETKKRCRYVVALARS